MGTKAKQTKLFSQYIELPAQLFEHIHEDDFDIYHERIYALMMNHQDFAQKLAEKKNIPLCYEESIASIAYLSRISYPTCQRKLNDLVEMGLLIKKSQETNNDLCEFIVLMPDQIKNVRIRQTNKERIADVKKGKASKAEATRLARNERRRAKYSSKKSNSTVLVSQKDNVKVYENNLYKSFGTVLPYQSDNGRTVLPYHKDYKNCTGTVLPYQSDKRTNSKILSNSLKPLTVENEKLESEVPNNVPHNNSEVPNNVPHNNSEVPNNVPREVPKNVLIGDNSKRQSTSLENNLLGDKENSEVISNFPVTSHKEEIETEDSNLSLDLVSLSDSLPSIVTSSSADFTFKDIPESRRIDFYKWDNQIIKEHPNLSVSERVEMFVSSL
ncbi:hypothetical protein [Enterobacter pseudoroggenkampii]|uniref:hypothetical protein n=1 Tax=Enterobacter pseudoroggenkampii TaxID=2996112 RepID=UPI0022651D9A|nr:hypothetical protein [Enterobacter pseudoroggenkampii]MCX8289087.1 hypothetical protein [Enterobacter pseudoroggenkampii]